MGILLSLLEHNGTGARYDVVETIPRALKGMSTAGLSTYECFKKIIADTRRELCIVSFCCNMSTSAEGVDILNRLVELANSKVRVCILVDSHSKDPDLNKLSSSSVSYTKVDIGLLHKHGVGNLLSSFWVSDGIRFYLGSASLTGGSLSTIKTLGVYSDGNARLARDLRRRFANYERISEGMCLYCMKFSTSYHMFRPFYNVFFSDSPEHMIGSHRTFDEDCVLAHIDAASSTIDMELISLLPIRRSGDGIVTYWPALKDALIRATLERNVRLRILVGYWSKTDVRATAAVRSLGELGVDSIDISVKVFSFQHAGGGGTGNAAAASAGPDDINNTKLIVVDGCRAHITSANMDGTHFSNHAFVSFNSLDAEMAKRLTEVFERDWTSPFSRPISELAR
ncbi:palmitylated EEV membrane glycoprotein [Western grey kangaroopox virus]|uniref:Palmitylated EEV membrane glycoprotein n=1 Tax=Western grey kangaroopox virus TaxID=1566307 RepID=A0A2C9DSH9_9POXV|nr:palmitylated EEV membrane glycoprotein [Western grey kangaroopox virus]ATI20962.1 palmitylated EEV membrane glycoprotein [Western grey kangaroopox virus]